MSKVIKTRFYYVGIVIEVNSGQTVYRREIKKHRLLKANASENLIKTVFCQLVM